VVDAWASVEQNNLNWVRHHQKELRSDVYSGLRDAALGDRDNNINLAEHGTRIILPSSFVGSERHMNQLFQDSMAICRAFGKPDLFLTMTANPNWPEIQDQLWWEAPPPHGSNHRRRKQKASDRPDIVARVFEQKKIALLKEINNGLFGRVEGMVHTIEFQKRGLPHMHLLIFLQPEDKIHNADQVDKIVSAQIPDPNLHPLLYETVTTCMLHGPCGDEKPNAPCMVNGQCSKHFPKEFREHTLYGENGYPLYARPNNGRTVEKNNFTYDNRYVVPHSPYLSSKFNCHINVEICASVESIKYIHKYIFKGHDRTTLELRDDQNRDEIKEYLDARYIGSVESCHHMFEFAMHAASPTVYRLPVHLEDQQLVYFNADDDLNNVLERGAAKDTALTAWFKINQTNPQARQTTYQNFPREWVYDNSKKAWKPRKQGRAIGRMYFASPSSGERFYLRLLLTVVIGATSFAHLRKVNAIQYNTFKEACFALGLLEDDQEWDICLHEAGEMQLGSALRKLFATILFQCNPTTPAVLWDKHRNHICDDLRHKLTQKFPNRDFSEDQVYDYGLHLINHILRGWGSSLADIPGMPPIVGDWGIVDEGNRLLNEQLDYNQDELAATVAENIAKFNDPQRAIFDAVMHSVDNNISKVFFLHSAGGCGKTFVSNTIASAVRAQGKICLCVASSGIAALLLDGGRTAHSTFKIPLAVNETSSCSFTRRSHLYPVLRQTSLIIWDEVPMQHKHAIEAVDRTLQDLLDSNSPFGGITVLFSGDFRQTLPVIPHGIRQQLISASISRSHIWAHVQMFYLHQNMRLEQSPEMQEFATWLLNVGAGEQLDNSERLIIPHHMQCPDHTIASLIHQIYPDIDIGEKDDQYFLDRNILAGTNDNVRELNSSLLESFPGETRLLLSADSVEFDDPGMQAYQPYSIEFLNSLVSSSLPLSHLALKVGCPVMLLRNLDASKGLCNGTRLRVLQIRTRVLKCRIMTGDRKFAGKLVFIPRITLAPTAEDLPIPLRRRQFPVRLAFAMTVNKSQGQSLRNVGLDLRSPVFSHGQLYVGLSRCTSGNRLKVLLKEEDGEKTTNIVYKEILGGLQL